MDLDQEFVYVHMRHSDAANGPNYTRKWTHDVGSATNPPSLVYITQELGDVKFLSAPRLMRVRCFVRPCALPRRTMNETAVRSGGHGPDGVDHSHVHPVGRQHLRGPASPHVHLYRLRCVK